MVLCIFNDRSFKSAVVPNPSIDQRHTTRFEIFSIVPCNENASPENKICGIRIIGAIVIARSGFFTSADINSPVAVAAIAVRYIAGVISTATLERIIFCWTDREM